ncbi:hypothetical protein GEMRC1_008773 [Eukaryota sp. GEM-RC1]
MSKKDPVIESLTSKFRIVSSNGSSLRIPRPKPQKLDDCIVSFTLGDYSKTPLTLNITDSLIESFKAEFSHNTPTISKVLPCHFLHPVPSPHSTTPTHSLLVRSLLLDHSLCRVPPLSP